MYKDFPRYIEENLLWVNSRSFPCNALPLSLCQLHQLQVLGLVQCWCMHFSQIAVQTLVFRDTLIAFPWKINLFLCMKIFFKMTSFSLADFSFRLVFCSCALFRTWGSVAAFVFCTKIIFRSRIQLIFFVIIKI